MENLAVSGGDPSNSLVTSISDPRQMSTSPDHKTPSKSSSCEDGNTSVTSNRQYLRRLPWMTSIPVQSNNVAKWVADTASARPEIIANDMLYQILLVGPIYPIFHKSF